MAFDDRHDEFKEHVKRSEAEKRRNDRLDHGNELSGAETGRIKRFFVGAASRLETVEKEEAERFWRTLAELLLNEAYRTAHESFGRFLDDYASAAETALEQARANAEAARAALDDALEGANTLDGHAVFVTDDGRIVYANGQEIDPADAESVVWREGAVSYAEYLALTEQVEVAAQTVTAISDYRVELGRVRERLNDPDNPFQSVEEMEQERERLEAEAPKLVIEVLRGDFSASPTGLSEPVGDKPIL